MADNDIASRQLREMIDKIYSSSLTTALLAWDAIHRAQDELEWEGKISPDERRINADIEYDGKVMTIKVNDVLPRKKNTSPGSLLRLYWMGNIVKAVKKLDYPLSLERALCIITVYGPRDVGWDVDNRAVSYIINGLRAAGVIPGDEWNKLSLLLLGGVDRKRPRTEIRVMEYPEDAIETLINNRQ